MHTVEVGRGDAWCLSLIQETTDLVEERKGATFLYEIDLPKVAGRQSFHMCNDSKRQT